MRTFLVWISRTPPGAVMLRAPRTSLIFDDLQVVGGEPLLRVVEVDLLGQDAGALHLRDHGTRCSVRWMRSVKSSSWRYV